MGEKYDDCEWDYGRQPHLRIRPDLRLSDAIKGGWPPPNYAQMRQWGQGGAELYSSALGGAVESVQRTRTDAEAIIRAAGNDRGALLANGDALVDRLQVGSNEFSEKLSWNRLLGTALQGEEEVDQQDLVRRTLGASRNTTSAANEHMGFLSNLFHGVVGTVEDAATSAFAAKTEAAMNRVVEVASTSSAELYRGVARRGLLEDPGPGTSATA